jgi:predicted AAA+ superfamily ATPase
MARVVQGRHSRDYGRFAENAVFLELNKRGMSSGFFRGRKEVDFVAIDSQQNVYLINVCMANTLPEREFEGIREFTETYPRAKAISLVLTNNTESKKDGIELIPLWKWLLK